MQNNFNTVKEILSCNFSSIPIDPDWNNDENKELKIHRIHSYPAKFPAFIATKAINYARGEIKNINKIADIFCGCGTVAFEAKQNNINFWGCDINPVATLIAKVKSKHFNESKLTRYYHTIINAFLNLNGNEFCYELENERIRYWFDEKHWLELSKLKKAIEISVPKKSIYHLFFHCAFSNILKSSSRWLTKSIKPQIDPDKEPSDILALFKKQFDFMVKANNENKSFHSAKTEIITANFLEESVKHPVVDMIITSPPYVTSYEYADLHQLSSLWLDYTDDYKKLRNGSIGSLYHSYDFSININNLNIIGSKIVSGLNNIDKSKSRAVAKYYLDMQSVSNKCYSMLGKKGIAFFVIADTEYKTIKIENAKHICISLINSGFKEIKIIKRRISGKILTPYRDSYGKFSSDNNSRKVYNEEFIVIARKK